MIALPRTSAGRTILAIALSALAHAIVLLAPIVKLPPREAPLPPLTAKLEPLPRTAAKLTPVKKYKSKPKPAPAVPGPAKLPETEPTKASPPDLPRVVPEQQLSEAPPVAPGQQTPKIPQIVHEPQPTEAPQIISEPQLPPPAETAQEARPAHPLPRHAQLTFIAYKGTSFSVGEARYRLDIDDDKSYTLKAGLNTTGIISLFTTFEMNQLSSGTLTAQGLRPDEFSETRNTASGRETLSALFNWSDKLLIVSGGREIPLPDQAQDILSFVFQLSQLPLENGVLPMHISNGKKLENYELAVGGEEELETRLGKLRAVPVHKVHGPNEDSLIVWLGLEYRLLPIKIRQIDRNGEISAEMVISDIRVADE